VANTRHLSRFQVNAYGWEGDDHLNYNHMALFYARCSSNHIEQADSYHAPILDFLPRAQWYAENAQNVPWV
jgi:hypothetical protein